MDIQSVVSWKNEWKWMIFERRIPLFAFLPIGKAEARCFAKKIIFSIYTFSIRVAFDNLRTLHSGAVWGKAVYFEWK